jgi:hypothetical protein
MPLRERRASWSWGTADRSGRAGPMSVCIRDQLAGESSSLRRRTRPGAEPGRGRNIDIGDMVMLTYDVVARAPTDSPPTLNPTTTSPTAYQLF